MRSMVEGPLSARAKAPPPPTPSAWFILSDAEGGIEGAFPLPMKLRFTRRTRR